MRRLVRTGQRPRVTERRQNVTRALPFGSRPGGLLAGSGCAGGVGMVVMLAAGDGL
jgi:hypothetical protein